MHGRGLDTRGVAEKGLETNLEESNGLWVIGDVGEVLREVVAPPSEGAHHVLSTQHNVVPFCREGEGI